MKDIQGKLIGKGMKIGIVLARFNEFIGSKLLSGAEDALIRHGVVKYLGNDVSKCTDDAHKGLYRAKVRYSSAEYEIKEINLKGSDLEIVFNEPVRAIAPGQSLVVYCRDVVILGGIIVG